MFTVAVPGRHLDTLNLFMYLTTRQPGLGLSKVLGSPNGPSCSDKKTL